MLPALVALALAAPLPSGAEPSPVTGTLDAVSAAVLPAIAPPVAGVPADLAQAMWQMELLRLAPRAFAAWVAHPEPLVRARAADALGRLRDVECVTPLTTLITDPVADVRAHAAFALGQTPTGILPLGRRWAVETDRAVQGRIAVAIGKQGGPEALEMLLPALSGPIAVYAADGLGRLGMRKVAGADSDRVVSALLDSTSFPLGDTRRRAVWALSRLGLTVATADSAMRLRALALEDGDALVRGWALRAWLGVATEAARLDGITLASGDPAVNVRIAAARGAAKHAGPGLTPVLVRLLADADLSVRIEAIAAVGAAPGVDAKALLTRPFGAGVPEERAAALRALAAKKALPGPASKWAEPSEPMIVRIAAVEAIQDRNRLLKLATSAPDPAIRSAAAGVLLEGAPRLAELVELLEGADLTIAQAAATAAGENPDPAAEPPLLAYLQRRRLSSEQAIEGVKALAAIYDTGRLPRPGAAAGAAIRPWLRHPAIEADAERLAALLGVEPPRRRHPARRLPLLGEVMRIRSARIFTSEGEIRVALSPDAAPYTVWNFARLAEDGYYDGLRFHRVVPDFVIQTGDPRGDGWGGPGYEIPDEINALTYGTGVMGMALSGPDTGGSQWFITLSPQPHLDGTYTVFGHVTYGMRSASAIQVGDTIERIEIERVP
ncbi:MAG: peptidylprolyl isomerase [Pseudomonadota bacterium]|nr:peptidylprolyl isomerase [Pseudomonadota bacterium]